MRAAFFASGVALACAVAASGAPMSSAGAATTVNAQGEAGATDYAGFPFSSTIYRAPWGCVNALPGNTGLLVGNLYWRAGSFFTDARDMAAATAAAASIAARGAVPTCIAQRWADTFMAAQPAQPGEPAFVAHDRANNGGTPLDRIPEYRQWVAWIAARAGLLDTAADGGAMPTAYRTGGGAGSGAWSGSFGWISPDTPLATADCPPGMAACSYGDWYAWQWSQTAALTGAFGFYGADFSNGSPVQPSFVHDFNPARIAAFAAWAKLAIPGDSVAAQAAHITGHGRVYAAWNDFCARGWAQFFAAMASRLGSATGRPALMVAGAYDYPGYNRAFCVDERIMAEPPGLLPHLLVVADAITMEVDRDGRPMTWGIGAAVVNAAREPAVRNGVFLSADDGNFRAAVAKFHPALSAAEQRQWGTRQLKRQWLEFAWAHIADRSGVTRRALAFAARDRWDTGSVDPAVTRLMQTIAPKQPFGIALYYSAAVERAIEEASPGANLIGAAYLNPDVILAARQKLPLNYVVSDAGLANLQPAAAPAGWLVLNAREKLPAAERAALRRIAPVYTSAAEAEAASPLRFTGGLAGTAFYDQRRRLIVTVSNPDLADGAADIVGSMLLRGLADGGYTMTDLFTKGVVRFTAAGGVAAVPVTVARWDTRAFAITRPGS